MKNANSRSHFAVRQKLGSSQMHSQMQLPAKSSLLSQSGSAHKISDKIH